MGKKNKIPDKGPSNAYLLSFGDTMTTLLAFFIVLNSLAEEQTGANLYRGTGSFVQTVSSFGMPGNLPGDGHSTAVSLETPGPLYVVPADDEASAGKEAMGPDENDDSLRIIDREREDFERFANELERLSNVQEEPAVTGEAVFDIFNPLNKEPPFLGAAYRDALDTLLPALYKSDHRVEVTVWATTPSPSAWKRAAVASAGIRDELILMGSLKQAEMARLTTTAKPWIDSVAKRPVVTIVVRKMGASGGSP